MHGRSMVAPLAGQKADTGPTPYCKVYIGVYTGIVSVRKYHSCSRVRSTLTMVAPLADRWRISATALTSLEIVWYRDKYRTSTSPLTPAATYNKANYTAPKISKCNKHSFYSFCTMQFFIIYSIFGQNLAS
jgi:hypothetical protein